MRTAPYLGGATIGKPWKEREPLPTIWEAFQELGAMCGPIPAQRDPPKRRPKRIVQHRALDVANVPQGE